MSKIQSLPPAPRPARAVITGAAGLVGQNLITLLAGNSRFHLVAIDKHHHNLAVLRELHPWLEIIEADLAEPGSWSESFEGADLVVQLHAQITGPSAAPFERNNIVATRNVLDAMKSARVRYLVHVSSSVVNSVANDDYTDTKKRQEQLVHQSGIDHCVLRPTLMFGWFDPKHLGWLSRFMEKTPVFPIPGDGRYMRQPLYVLDFCRATEWCMVNRPRGAVYDLVGQDRVDYVDIIKAIRKVKQLNTPIVHIPVGFFAALLHIYGLFTKTPPFTADQLVALTAGDDFKGVDMRATFGFEPTPFEEAIRETYTDPRYSGVVLEKYV